MRLSDKCNVKIRCSVYFDPRDTYIWMTYEEIQEKHPSDSR